MRICVISDTHRLENEIEIPTCDLLIHAGTGVSSAKVSKPWMRSSHGSRSSLPAIGC
jgi:hypothetical protein